MHLDAPKFIFLNAIWCIWNTASRIVCFAFCADVKRHRGGVKQRNISFVRAYLDIAMGGIGCLSATIPKEIDTSNSWTTCRGRDKNT
jgi:hypothetical protein